MEYMCWSRPRRNVEETDRKMDRWRTVSHVGVTKRSPIIGKSGINNCKQWTSHILAQHHRHDMWTALRI